MLTAHKNPIRPDDGFSLIELLVVMGIIGVLVGLGASAFRSNNEAGVSAGAAQVSSAISGARQLAISKNCRTRFFIVTGSPANPENWRLRRFGVLKVKDDTADTSASAEFVPASQIQELSTGVYFRKSSHESEETLVGGESMFDPANLEQTKVQGPSETQYAFIEFLPTGGTSRASTVNIFEMEHAPSADQSLTDNKNYIRIGIAQYTGRIKFERPESN